MPQHANIPAPVAKGRRSKNPKPRTIQRKDGVTVIHREFIASIPGSVNFSAIPFSINPGLPTMFPWLSQMAPNYQSYKAKRMSFEYIPTCATTQTGSVYLGVEYNASDPVPTSKQQLASWDETSYGSPWVANTHHCKPNNLHKRSSYFVRNGPVEAGQDIKLYDIGYLVVATQGNTSTAEVGEVWISYEVDLITPQLNNVGLGNSLSGHFSTTALSVAPTVVGNAPLVPTVVGSVLTLRAIRPYQALLAMSYNNTGVIGVGGTAQTTVLAQNVGGADPDIVLISVNFRETGETQTFTATGTVDTIDLRYGQYKTSLA